MIAIIRNDADREKLIDHIRQLKLDKPHVVNIKLHKKKRSLPQNRLMWMWLHCIKDETGNSVDSLYQYFCSQYLPWNGELVFGTEVHTIGGSSQLNTKEFTDFLDNIKVEMAEQGIYLPQPNDLGWDEFYTRYEGRK